MAFAYVQNWTANGGTATASSNTLTISGATSNNLLIAAVVIRTTVASATFNTPTGWTKISDGADGMGGAFYYRVASGTSADNFAADWGITKRWAMVAIECSGLATSSVLETSNENASQLNSTTLTISTGSVTPSTAGAAVALVCADTGASGVDATNMVIDSSFTKRVFAGSGSAAAPLLHLATLDLSDTTSKNPTWTGDRTVLGMYAAIAVFAEAGAGPSFQSAWARGSNQIIQGVSS